MGRRPFLCTLAVALAAVMLSAALAAPRAVASEEPAEASEPATITTVLHPGWNMVGWVGPETLASNLFDEIPALAGIFAWDSEAGGYRHRARPIVHLLDPLTLTPGRGLWLYLDGETSFEWEREASEHSVLLELQAGRNLVAWAGRDATPLEEATVRFGERFVRAWRWDAGASQYRLYHPHAATNTLTELNHGDALWVELTEDSRWWQSGTAPPPVVFLGEFTDERRAEIGGWVDSVRAVFAERWAVEAEPAIYVGDPQSIAPTYRRIRGLEPSDEHCSDHALGVIFTKPSCVTEGRIAHEYFHAVQDNLSGASYYDVPNWLLEGSAEYARSVHVALQSEELTVPELLDRRQGSFASVLVGHPLPRLAEISAFDDFHALPDSIGYWVGFIAARWLVDHSSEESMIGFFRAMADDAYWQDAFESTFGLSSADFEETFKHYLATVAPRLPHLTDDEEEPVMVFLGDVSPANRGAVRAEFDGLQTFFNARLDSSPVDHTIYISADAPASLATHLRVFGANQPAGFCSRSTFAVVTIIVLTCHEHRPYALIRSQFRASAAQHAPWPDWGPLWLIEGGETYIEHAYRAAEAIEDYTEARHREISRAGRIADLLRVLDTRAVFDEVGYWEARGLSFLAGEWLVQRAGEPAILEYYRQLPDSDSWEDAFEAAFGIAIDEFYDAFEAYRARVAPPN